MLKVYLNGSELFVDKAVTLEEFLLQKSLHLESVVVEYNKQIIKRDELAAIILKDQDSIEVLRFVGGG